MILDNDAFSSGQMGSKIWLARKLELVVRDYQSQGLFKQPLRIGIIGGWYGILNLVLGIRENLDIRYVRSIDLDPEACKNADLVNEYWVWKNWKFKSLCADANDTELFDYDVVINSSVEHIDSLEWYDNIPEGTLVVLQSNDMPHDDHVSNHTSLAEFSKSFNLSKTAFEGELRFDYGTWQFDRYMKIGIK
jgi:hypothetical protein